MIREERFKLIYYPVGNHFQLFDMIDDPRELTDLGADSAHADTIERFKTKLIKELYGTDLDWFDGDQLVGYPDKPYRWAPHRSLNSQRGDYWPPSPVVDIPQIEWTREKKS